MFQTAAGRSKTAASCGSPGAFASARRQLTALRIDSQPTGCKYQHIRLDGLRIRADAAAPGVETGSRVTRRLGVVVVLRCRINAKPGTSNRRKPRTLVQL